MLIFKASSVEESTEQPGATAQPTLESRLAALLNRRSNNVATPKNQSEEASHTAGKEHADCDTAAEQQQNKDSEVKRRIVKK